jgi:arsenite methyltransferase
VEVGAARVGPVMAQDRWARWLRQDRDAGDAVVRDFGARMLAGYRDGVLDRAAIEPGDVLLDVGTGTGLVGLAALDRVGPAGRVIFSDISADLLEGCRASAGAAAERCEFVQAGADDLGAVPDGSVDVVTTRSVLIYVHRKQEAFAEFFRVLRPGGRLSVFEPINGFAADDRGGGMLGMDLSPVADLAAKVFGGHARAPRAEDPMLNFDERDLLRWARDAGFGALQLDYHADVEVPAPAGGCTPCSPRPPCSGPSRAGAWPSARAA